MISASLSNIPHLSKFKNTCDGGEFKMSKTSYWYVIL